MTVQVSQATLDALIAQRDSAQSAATGYQGELDRNQQMADDLTTVIADCEVAS